MKRCWHLVLLQRFFVASLLLVVFSGSAVWAEAALQRFHQDWPLMLQAVALDGKRNYILYVYVPAATPIDISDAEALRTSYLKAALRDANTASGHTAVAWHCDGKHGMISMSGGMDAEARKLVFGGWGATALLSTYRNGTLEDTRSLLRWHEDEFLRDRGHLIAAEVTPKKCKAMQDFIVRFMSAPSRPAQHYGFTLLPEKFEGGTCMSFALALGRQAGHFTTLLPLLYRQATLHQAAVGWRKKWPKVMVPFAITPVPRKDIVVPKLRVMFGPLNTGPVVASARMLDTELLFAAFNGVRETAGLSMKWHKPRMMSAKDPLVSRAFKAGMDWAKSFKTVRVSKKDGIVAVVLEN